VLQSVAVCCSVLQCVAVNHTRHMNKSCHTHGCVTLYIRGGAESNARSALRTWSRAASAGYAIVVKKALYKNIRYVKRDL